MPVVKVDRIVSFSSEDKVYTANNLLGNNVTRGWKCSSSGEKSATVIFQLHKAVMITGIDIGNDHSAYIEVYVSRSGETDGDYKTLLVMSSFMSALDSRESRNINRVRMFKTENFSKPESDEKWDRIKVICTQPFNRHVQYGLSFIKFYTNESDEANSGKMIGMFHLRPDSPIDLNSPLFSKRKQQAEDRDKPLSAASSIREATYSLLNDTTNSPVRSSKLLPSFLKNSASKKKNKDSVVMDERCFKPRNRNEIFYTEDEEKPHPKIDKLVEKKNIEKKAAEGTKKDEQKKTQGKKKNNQTQGTSHILEEKIKENEKASSSRNSENNEIKRTIKKEKESIKRKLEVENGTPKKMKCQTIKKRFEKLLEDVVLVISGIQNPDRSHLRDKILQMGGKYKANWDTSCTHLVCAFINTPKFHEVKGKGKIVTRQWVEECYTQRKKIPWRRYALDNQDKNGDESEEEICEEKNVQSPSKQPVYDDDYDDTMEQASDTEEKIEKIRNLKYESLNSSAKIEESDVLDQDLYSVETDTEDPPVLKKEKPFDFFKGKTFFLDHNFEDCIEEMLKTYIFIHEGSLIDDPTENIDYIICGKDEACTLNEINEKAICILPDWIVDCHKCRQFIPPDEYHIL